MLSLRSNPALRARCPINRRRVGLPFGATHCCLKSTSERARPAVTWSTSTSATRALRGRMCALGCSYLVAWACMSKKQPIMRIEDRLFDRGWVRSAMATRKCGNIYFRKYFMAVRKFTNIFVLLLILMVGSRDILFLVCFT